MDICKTTILDSICYTSLVYARINKKLGLECSELEIERLIYDTINEATETDFEKVGKNIYATNAQRHIRVTINAGTYRIITVDKIEL